MKKSTASVIVPIKDEPPIAVELIESAIVSIAEGMKKINATRLKRTAIVVLLNHATKVSQRDINHVLDGMADLEKLYLVPKAPSK